MALIDDVRARIKTATMLKLSRYREDGASTEDTTWTAAIASDCEDYFARAIGRSYDTTRGEDRSAAVQLFLWRAHEATVGAGSKATESYRQAWERLAAQLRTMTGGHAERMVPFTTSELDPTQDQYGARPWADPVYFPSVAPPRSARGGRR